MSDYVSSAGPELSQGAMTHVYPQYSTTFHTTQPFSRFFTPNSELGEAKTKTTPEGTEQVSALRKPKKRGRGALGWK